MADDQSILGSWSATRWQYVSREHPWAAVDVVAGLEGSVTVSLSAGAFVLTWDVPGFGSGSIGGTARVNGGELLLHADGSGDEAAIRYRVTGETLALSGEGSAWSFDGGEEEPADFAAVLVRL